MTTPYQTPGDQREDHAEAIAAILAAIFTRIEMALIGTVASLAQRVAAGGLLPVLARRQLGQTVHATYAAAQPQVQAALEAAARQTVASARQALPPGGYAISVMRTVPAPPVPAVTAPLADVTASIEKASQTAASSAGHVLDAAITAATETPAATAEAAAGAGGPPKPPAGNIFSPFRGEDDIYRQAVQRAVQPGGRAFVTQSLSLGRIQAAQQALDDLAEHGITGFTDSAGRNWDLTSYVEMATRTAVSSLWDDLYNGAAIRSGHDLIETYTHSTEGSCPRCIPWLGKTLSLTGATEGYPTLDEARAAGFRHPNCRCGWIVLGAGELMPVTSPVPMGEAASVYKASQRQRALERRVRAAGRRYQAAITPQARRDARRDLMLAKGASDAHRRATGLRMTKVGVKRREHPAYAH